MNTFFRRTLFWPVVTGALLAVAALFPSYAQAAPEAKHTAPAKVALPVSPLLHAKSIQVQETISAAGQDGKLTKVASLDIQAVRPDKTRIEMTRPAQPGGQSGALLYVSDGNQKHFYDPSSNTYRSEDPGLSSEASLDLILNPNSLPKGKLSKDTLDGLPMVLSTQPSMSEETAQGPIKITDKLWIVAKTGLPYRRALFLTQGGKTHEVEQFDFAKWSLNQPIASARFAWNPPAGAKEFAEPKLLAKGTTAPDFAAQTPDGKTVHLSDFKGKPVVIDFWSTWCGPCQEAMPHLEKVYQQIKGMDVAVLAVCVWDDKDAYDKWVKQNIGTKYHFSVAFDPAGKDETNSIATSLYGVDGIPTQYVIDKDGKVAATSVGYSDGDTSLEQNLAAVGIKVEPSEKSASAK
ncbi:MAG TPA: redoxin domain-containing protein [Capsulimonadaceae bacterium]|nr:redoxin domain-containing protein [Capsulimonadaceae bacterium]